MASKKRRRTCPICEGAGKLTAEQEKRLKCLLDLATWARELQKRVEAEEASQGLTPEDLQFLGDLGISWVRSCEQGHQEVSLVFLPGGGPLVRGLIFNHKRGEFLTNGSKFNPQQFVDRPLSHCSSLELVPTWSPFLVWYDSCI